MIAATLIALSLIDDNPYQPRLSYDEASIRETAESINANGLLQIPTARPIGDGRYQLAFGHRRRRAYSLLAQDDPAYGTMPLIIRELDDLAMVKQTWSENRDRRDISGYEEARAIEKYIAAFGWNQKQVAEHLGLDRSTVTNKLGLLKLPAAVLALFESGQLSERQGMALRPLSELPINNWAMPISLYGPAEVRLVRTLHELIPVVPMLAADKIRDIVEQALDKVTTALDKKPWAQEEMLGADAQSATCKTCTLRMKHTNRCPSLACVDLKERFSRKRLAQAAAAAAKLPAVGVTHGEYDLLGAVPLPALRAEARRRGCMWLSVAHVPYGAHEVPDHPDNYIVCAHGKGGRCDCQAAVLKAARPATSAAAQTKTDRKAIREQYQAPAERAITTALTSVPQGVLRLLLARMAPSAERKLDGAAPAAQFAAALGSVLVREEIKYAVEYTDLSKAKGNLEAMLTKAGLPVPWLDAPAPAPAPATVTRRGWPDGTTDADIAAVIRTHLVAAREFAGIAHAHWHLDTVRKALSDIADRDIAVTLHAEFDMTALSVAQVEASSAS